MLKWLLSETWEFKRSKFFILKTFTVATVGDLCVRMASAFLLTVPAHNKRTGGKQVSNPFSVKGEFYQNLMLSDDFHLTYIYINKTLIFLQAKNKSFCNFFMEIVGKARWITKNLLRH